jgi:uncharacterized repeat protein (TIGR01451 family)
LFFTIIAPAKSSLATSANDIIYGASSKEQVLKAYKNNRDNLGRTDIKAIYDYYGVGVDQIASATKQRIGSRQRSFISTGRSTSPGNDTFVPISGVHNGGVYQRSLSSWDVNHQENWYDTISGISKFGFRFWVIVDGCGNIVFEQGKLAPSLDVAKKIKDVDLSASTIHYLIQFKNYGPGVGNKVNISDVLPTGFKYISYKSNVDLKFSKSDQSLSWKIDNSGSRLMPSQKWYSIDLYLKIEPVNTQKRICNNVSISAEDTPTTYSDESELERCLAPKPEQPKPPAEAAPRLSTDKKVSNLTQAIANADNTTAKPGDKLKYTVFISNDGGGIAKDFKLDGEFGESINDLLEYSDLIDRGDANFNSKTNFLSWSAVNIAPGETIQKSFTVQVKDPLPLTPVSASDPLSYDFVMQNKYGRTVTIHLEKPASKALEQVVHELPNTGPGSSIIISFIVITIVGYFYFRSRLLSKELEIIHSEFSSGNI